MSATEQDSSDSQTGASKGRRSFRWGTTAGVATLFLLLRLLAVSDWNWSTAFAVAETSDFSDALPIVFGTLFAEPMLAGVLLAVLFALSFVELIWPAVPRKAWSFSLLLFPAALLVAALTWMGSFGDVWFILLILGTAGAVVLIRLLWRRGIGHESMTELFRRVGVLAVGALLVLAVAVETPWMSREKIVTADETFYGYVLEAEAGFIRVLTEDREVLIFNSSDVASREIVE